MRIVGRHEHAIAGEGGAPVGVAGDGTRCARALEVPDLPSAAGVEREALVGSGHVHDAVHDQRRALEPARLGDGEHPTGREPRDVGLVDLRERRVAVAAGVPVVGGPRGFRGDFADALTLAPQQPDAAVGGAHLEVVKPFAKHGAFDGAAGRRRKGARRRFGRGVPLDRAQEPDERGQLGLVDDARRHAAQRDALAHQRRELPVIAGAETLKNRWAHLGAVAVAAVATAAARFERPPARIDVLGHGRHGQQDCGQEQKHAHGNPRITEETARPGHHST